MNQHQRELNMEVARATGESIETIEAMGFSVLTTAPPWVVVDHRARLGDLTRQKTRRRMKAREAPARKPRPAASPVMPTVKVAPPSPGKPAVEKMPSAGGRGLGGGGVMDGGSAHRVAARVPEWREWPTSFPRPQIRALTFDKWRA